MWRVAYLCWTSPVGLLRSSDWAAETEKGRIHLFYVFIIRSLQCPEKVYVCFTEDLRKRISVHNAGGSLHTSKFKPWRLEFYAGFREKYSALSFERYLKSHSGVAFARKRLLPPSKGIQGVGHT